MSRTIRFLDGTQREVALQPGADLSDADLRGADLSGADLRSADLSGANLSGAALSGADLRRADLSGASLRGADLYATNLGGADLRSADLSGASLNGAYMMGADMRSADLSRAYIGDANLSGANLSGANLSGRGTVPVVVGLAASIPTDERLEMSTWHSECGTAHCLAGWAVTLGGEAGAELERQIGTVAAGVLIWHVSEGVVPDFYSTDADAREWLRARKRGE